MCVVGVLDLWLYRIWAPLFMW